MFRNSVGGCHLKGYLAATSAVALQRTAPWLAHGCNSKHSVHKGAYTKERQMLEMDLAAIHQNSCTWWCEKAAKPN